MEEEDPLESIASECKITFSQDEKLKKCRFALESEENEEEEDSLLLDSVQVTGIVMVSPPESNEDSLEGDVFHTPPEQQRSQSLSGSEDQGPEIRPGHTQVVLGNDIGGFTESENAVDLGKDSAALGFSVLNELDNGNCVMNSDALVFLEPNVVDCVIDVVCEPDLSKSITVRTVDLGTDSDTLVVSEMNVDKRIGDVEDVVSDIDLSKSSTENNVDLGKDSDALLFSEVNVIKRIGGVKDVTSDRDLSKSSVERTVDLGKDSHTLVSEMNVEKIDDVKDVTSDCGLSKSSIERTVDLCKDTDTLIFSEVNDFNKIDDVKDVVSDIDLSKSSTEKTGYLGMDSDALLFPEVNVIKRIDSVKDVASDRDLSKNSKERRNFDLGKDSDTLLFSEVNVVKRIDAVRDVVSDCDLSKIECDLKGCKVLESKCEQSGMNECNVSAEIIEYTEPIVIKSVTAEIEVTEVVNMEVEESCKEMGVRVSENPENVEERVKGENSGGHSTDQNVEEYVAGGYVSGGGLLTWFMEPEENEGLSVFEQALNDVKIIMDILEAAENSRGEGTPDTDFIKAAEERGLTFDRPRWWPPEGFDDQVTNNV
ncbi:uncharacterized protein LOC141697972 [Apium graveolens]|uniref:uncharacterized protein LOC141697972 n=1 Tax=Apium graveolens TaxID=4045 RepID=UPI003D7B4D5A